jgi:hypothetical protein
MKRQLFFLHVQKTGGATLTGALSNRFAACDTLQLYYSPEPDVSGVDSYRYVAGHVSISFLDRFRERPYLFTVLRDPVERALSAYSFYRTRPPEFADQFLLFGRGPEAYERGRECLRLARECSLEEFIERAPEIAVEYFGNRQARVLGGFGPEGGDERLDEALAGLERCDFVGVTERLSESTEWLVRRLGWAELTPLPRINVTSARLPQDHVSRRGLDTLRELTAVDRELYRHGVERFERQLAEWAPLGDRQDRSAQIADAPLVSDLRFDQAIRGAGWVGREPVEGRNALSWIGDTNRAWVDLASDRTADSVVIEIARALEQEILESLRISVNGRKLSHELAERDGAIVATAPLRWWRLRGRRPTTRVTPEVERTTRPCDIDPASNDDRDLSIAVSRIALGRS